MCLGVPGKILEINGNTARIDVAGTKKNASLTLLRGAGVGDYVIIHAGFAIEKIDAAKAEETLSLINGLIN